MAAQALNTAREINGGSRERSLIFVVVALAVLREGSETVLFLYSLATSSEDGLHTTISGGVSGLGAGLLVGALLYTGLLRIPLRWFFSITSVLVLLLAASMASQAARFLIQADLLPSLGAPLRDKCLVGKHCSRDVAAWSGRLRRTTGGHAVGLLYGDVRSYRHGNAVRSSAQSAWNTEG